MGQDISWVRQHSTGSCDQEGALAAVPGKAIEASARMTGGPSYGVEIIGRIDKTQKVYVDAQTGQIGRLITGKDFA